MTEELKAEIKMINLAVNIQQERTSGELLRAKLSSLEKLEFAMKIPVEMEYEQKC